MYENEIYSDDKRENTEERYFDRIENPQPAVYRQEQSTWQSGAGAGMNMGTAGAAGPQGPQGMQGMQGMPGPIPAEPVKQPRQKKGYLKKTVAALGLGLAFGAFAGLGFYGVCKATGVMDRVQAVGAVEEKTGRNNSFRETVPQEMPDIKSVNPQTVVKDTTDISGLVEEVMPAMVSIVNNATEEMNFWGQTYRRESAYSGTGIIISEKNDELLIATNQHVAVDSTKLEVTFIDGSTAEAKIKGMDADMDLAVLAVSLKDVNADTRAAISIAKLGDSDDLKLGKPVIVIGNALGYGQSVTNGIISGLNRELEMEDGSTGTFIQTNAAVNPGNSGGALFNINGEVIGIVSSKIGGSAIEGMGYAIPISSASPIISEMMERETRGDKVASDKMGYLGVTLQEITSDARLYYNMPAGVFIYEVLPDTGAAAAGIMKGDIITKLEGQKVGSYEDLQGILQYYAVGETVTVSVSRWENGEYVSRDMEVTLGARPKD